MNRCLKLTCWTLFLILWLPFTPAVFCQTGTSHDRPTVTILCYMNGDNDLSQEVLHALDMMERIGSSEQVNIVALVDGHPDWLGPFAAQWAQTKLVRVESDSQMGFLNPLVLEQWGEANLGDPQVLERFIRTALRRYPADRYLFYTFSHSQGVIDTRKFARSVGPETVKSVSISSDTTSQDNMNLSQFREAIYRGLDGRRFELMVLFSCLASMVEVGHALSDVTNFLVASEDEIRLFNQPSGSYQIRGLRFEEIIARLKQNPAADAESMGRIMVDSHVSNYQQDVFLPAGDGNPPIRCRFLGGMALVDCRAMPSLVQSLDELARGLISYANLPDATSAMKYALSKTKRFASFLDLEYYDLYGFVKNLRGRLLQPLLIRACDAVIACLTQDVLLYERHTPDSKAKGMSIYLSNPLVPENIFQSHQAMYLESRFSKETQWDEMITIYRQRLKTSLSRNKFRQIK